MSDPYDPLVTEILEDQDEQIAERLPAWGALWIAFVHTVTSTVHFLFIAFLAMAIDLGLHWFERRPFVEMYKLSPFIKTEVELMAYTLATIDCFLFVRVLVKPIVGFLLESWRSIKQ